MRREKTKFTMRNGEAAHDIRVAFRKLKNKRITKRLFIGYLKDLKIIDYNLNPRGIFEEKHLLQSYVVYTAKYDEETRLFISDAGLKYFEEHGIYDKIDAWPKSDGHQLIYGYRGII